MRRMIPTKLIDWIKSLKDKFIHNSETNTLEVGGNLEVDGNVQVNGEYISSMPTDVSIFGDLSQPLIYSKEEIINIILKHRINGFIDSKLLLQLIYLNVDASYPNNSIIAELNYHDYLDSGALKLTFKYSNETTIIAEYKEI